jgi:hypothetical protein
MSAVMARPGRIQYPGAFHHVMASGNHGQAVSAGGRERELFLKALGEACIAQQRITRRLAKAAGG